MHHNIRYCFFVIPAGAERIRKALSASAVSVHSNTRLCQCDMGFCCRPHTLVPHFVHHVYYNIDFIHSSSIEVLPHRQRQLILRDPSRLFLACHRGRLSSNARIRQECLSIRRRECSWRRKVVRDSVGVQEFQRFVVPLHLHTRWSGRSLKAN